MALFKSLLLLLFFGLIPYHEALMLKLVLNLLKLLGICGLSLHSSSSS